MSSPAGGRAGARRGGRPGPVGPAREQVSEIQRARMLGAMVEVACERGAAGATVAHVVARSGVSRRTFYETFADREDCFIAAFEDAIGRASAGVVGAYEAEKGWQARIRAGLAALLRFLDADPDAGRLCVVEALGAGPRVLERRAVVVAALVRAVDEGRDVARVEPPPLTAEGVVGGVLAVIHQRLLEAPQRSFGELLGPLMGMVLLPYLGQAAARKELARPVPKGPPPARRREDPLRDLDMRLTYRTVRVLLAIAQEPGASNRTVGAAAGVADQGQISKLLRRLQTLGLIENTGEGHTKGEPNAWRLTARGLAVEHTITTQSSA